MSENNTSVDSIGISDDSQSQLTAVESFINDVKNSTVVDEVNEKVELFVDKNIKENLENTPKEIKKYLKKLDKKMRKFMKDFKKKADINKDGTISISEFKNGMVELVNNSQLLFVNLIVMFVQTFFIMLLQFIISNTWSWLLFVFGISNFWSPIVLTYFQKFIDKRAQKKIIQNNNNNDREINRLNSIHRNHMTLITSLQETIAGNRFSKMTQEHELTMANKEIERLTLLIPKKK